jgi:hypothetical protein
MLNTFLSLAWPGFCTQPLIISVQWVHKCALKFLRAMDVSVGRMQVDQRYKNNIYSDPLEHNGSYKYHLLQNSAYCSKSVIKWFIWFLE